MKNFAHLVVGAGIAVSLVLATTATSLAAQHHTPSPPVYLALGDSVGAGYQNQSINTDRACTDATGDVTGQRGYTCLLYRRMLKVEPSLQFTSLALAVSPGEDSCGFQNITNCENVATRVDAAPGDTAPFDINSVAQLTAAESFISTHNVQVISLNLGGNDFLPLLALAQMTGDCSAYGNANCFQAAENMVPSVGQRLVNNIETIVGTLRTVAPHAIILLGDQYDPLSGLPASALGSNGAGILSLAASALSNYQSAIQQIASATGSTYVDEYDLFTGIAPTVTWITSSENIHPNASGYTLLANKYWQGFLHASNTSEFIHVVALKKVKTGRQTFTITTLPESTVTTTITYALHGWSYTVTKSSTLTGVTNTLTQKWKVPSGVKTANYSSCSSVGGGASKCQNGKFIIA